MIEDQPDASPLVLKVYIGGKPSQKKKNSGKNLSRVSLALGQTGNNAKPFYLDVLKAMFDAFVNRLLAYNFQTHMGNAQIRLFRIGTGLIIASRIDHVSVHCKCITEYYSRRRELSIQGQ